MEVALYSFGRIDIVGNCNEVYGLFSEINDSLLIDRLYKRYVYIEDNFLTLNLLSEKSCEIKCDLIKKLINKFESGIKKSESSFKCFGYYYPLRLGISDMPYPLIEENIPLEDYDNLEGDPLWMRPEYMLEKYGK